MFLCGKVFFLYHRDDFLFQGIFYVLVNILKPPLLLMDCVGIGPCLRRVAGLMCGIWSWLCWSCVLCAQEVVIDVCIHY